jgi:hypothetical protein
VSDRFWIFLQARLRMTPGREFTRSNLDCRSLILSVIGASQKTRRINVREMTRAVATKNLIGSRSNRKPMQQGSKELTSLWHRPVENNCAGAGALKRYEREHRTRLHRRSPRRGAILADKPLFMFSSMAHID